MALFRDESLHNEFNTYLYSQNLINNDQSDDLKNKIIDDAVELSESFFKGCFPNSDSDKYDKYNEYINSLANVIKQSIINN